MSVASVAWRAWRAWRGVAWGGARLASVASVLAVAVAAHVDEHGRGETGRRLSALAEDDELVVHLAHARLRHRRAQRTHHPLGRLGCHTVRWYVRDFL